MDKIILTGASSTIGKRILLSNKTNKFKIFSQINTGKKIKKKNISYIKSNFLNEKSLNKFIKILLKQKNKYRSLIHLTSGKLNLKRFSEYEWEEVEEQIIIQVKSLYKIMSTLYKQERLNNNFNLIVVSSYITEKYNYPKGMSAYFLGKTLLENYIQVLKKEIVHTKVKFKIVKPKIFNSAIHSNLPNFYLEKNLKNKTKELDITVRDIIKNL